MKMLPATLRLISRITILALLAMLWSDMPMDIAAVNAAPLGEICSTGARPAAIDGGAATDSHLQHQHCVFCAKHGVAPVLPVRMDQVLAVPAHFSAALGRHSPALLTVRHWRQRPSRGPPAIAG